MEKSKKYIQKKTITVSTAAWKGKTPYETRRMVMEYYEKHYKGHEPIVNLDLNIKIAFAGQAKRKLAFGGNIYPEKAALVEALPDMLRHATYNNFGEKKNRTNPMCWATSISRWR